MARHVSVQPMSEFFVQRHITETSVVHENCENLAAAFKRAEKVNGAVYERVGLRVERNRDNLPVWLWDDETELE